MNRACFITTFGFGLLINHSLLIPDHEDGATRFDSVLSISFL